MIDIPLSKREIVHLYGIIANVQRGMERWVSPRMAVLMEAMLAEARSLKQLEELQMAARP